MVSLLCILCGCAPLAPVPSDAAIGPAAAALPVQVVQRAVQAGSCSGAFVPHDLDHVSTVPGGDEVRQFEANGGGVAINDLDGDGDLDIVLANHRDPNTILWNEGALRFRTERIAEGDARGAYLVDLDGDGLLDILFSRRVSAPNYWRNLGQAEPRFAFEDLPGVSKPLYALNWGDLDLDGDLDFVGGTYDAGLLAEFGQDFLTSSDAGVYLYTNEAGRFTAHQLADQAQALALTLTHLDGDGRLDILVGNDFGVPDYVWLNQPAGWAPLALSSMSHSTMSYDAGDVDNDGQPELFATDMKPYPGEAAEAWEPLMMAMMDDPHMEGDPQLMENVLQSVGADGTFVNEAAVRGVDATGWSWSAKFGDLDQDGFLDLYVVNGMMEAETFAHLPNHELVEQNQAFRNDGRGHFQNAPAWGLGSQRSGRGMSMGDLDGDGDLDIVVNNLRGPAQLFENQLCEGASLQVALRWPQSGNTHAIGALLTLHTSHGVYQREVKAASGYLSGDPSRIHFGFPQGATVEQLVIQWPDGARSTAAALPHNSVVTITR